MSRFIFAAALLLSSAVVQAEKVICVFDPVGAGGDITALMKDFQLKAAEWGADIKIKSLTDESIIVNELKAGKCAGALLTGINTRPFNRFAATVEAVGGTLGDQGMRNLLATLLSLPEKKAQKYFRNSFYEIAGIMPAGSIYAFMSDRELYELDKLQGKRIAVIDGDAVSQSIIKKIGGSPVVATTTSFAGKFNNGSVDMVFSPAVAYEPLELYRGLGEKGGITDYAFLQLTFQLIIRWDQFPEGFAAKARETTLLNFDSAFDFIERESKKIDPKYWVKVPKKNRDNYDSVLQSARITLRDEGVYNGTMLKIMRKLRCKEAPTRAECAENLE
jgi:hypothetical protein